MPRQEPREYIESRSVPEPNSGCWLWLAALHHTGYGVAWNGTRQRFAHQMSYEAHVGAIPPGMCVCHRCDNPPCCNPDHLFLGTVADNNADRAAKGRSARNKTNRRLSDDDVRAIRAALAAGSKQEPLAEQYGVGTRAISKIKCGQRWRDLP